MYKNIAVKVVKYYFIAGALVFISSFTLTLIGYTLGMDLGLSPQ
jgi:hypothetical protein